MSKKKEMGEVKNLQLQRQRQQTVLSIQIRKKNLLKGLPCGLDEILQENNLTWSWHISKLLISESHIRRCGQKKRRGEEEEEEELVLTLPF